MMTIESFRIDNKGEADAYLRDMLAKPEYRSMNEVEVRAQKLIPNPRLRAYFINKAKEVLT